MVALQNSADSSCPGRSDLDNRDRVVHNSRVSFLKSIRPDVRVFLASALFRSDKLESNTEKIEAFACLDVIEKACATAKKKLYDSIVESVRSCGNVLESGHTELRVGDITLTLQKKVGKEPNTDQVKILLAEKGLSIEKGFDEVKSWVYNPSKVSSLVERGFLEEAQIEALRSVKHALVPTVGRRFKDALAKDEPTED